MIELWRAAGPHGRKKNMSKVFIASPRIYGATVTNAAIAITNELNAMELPAGCNRELTMQSFPIGIVAESEEARFVGLRSVKPVRMKVSEDGLRATGFCENTVKMMTMNPFTRTDSPVIIDYVAKRITNRSDLRDAFCAAIATAYNTGGRLKGTDFEVFCDYVHHWNGDSFRGVYVVDGEEIPFDFTLAPWEN